MSLELVLPVILPLFNAWIILVFHYAFKASASLLNLVGMAAHLFICCYLWRNILEGGTQVLNVGNWPTPFGIVFVLDLFSAGMILIAGLVGFFVALFIWSEAKITPTSPYYAFAYQVTLAGVCGTFSTGDVFNLYVWFEVMLMASFILLAFERKRAQLDGTLKYMVINLMGSALFLIGIAMLFSVAGTLNIAHLSMIFEQRGYSTGALAAFGFLMAAFGMKAGVFPLFFWLPASYHTSRTATAALLSGLLTKVGIYCLFRVSILVFAEPLRQSSALLAWIAALTMLTGVIGAISQYDIKRILSFHIISQIGYMTLGLAIGTPLSIAASLFYVFHHIIVKTNLFLISGAVEGIKGSTDLKVIGSLYSTHFGLAILFLLPALSLAGVPPLSGFFAKFGLILSAAKNGDYLIGALALIVGILTLLSMLKIWNEAFWKSQPKRELGHITANKLKRATLLPIFMMSFITLALGLWPEMLLSKTSRMASELVNPAAYRENVFKGAHR